MKKIKENEINKLKKLSKNEKKAMFKRRVSIEGAYDFELFCNYMKTQTHEIHNIRFTTPNGKLNELRLQVRSPNSQPKKIRLVMWLLCYSKQYTSYFYYNTNSKKSYWACGRNVLYL